MSISLRARDDTLYIDFIHICTYDFQYTSCWVSTINCSVQAVGSFLCSNLRNYLRVKYQANQIFPWYWYFACHFHSTINGFCFSYIDDHGRIPTSLILGISDNVFWAREYLTIQGFKLMHVSKKKGGLAAPLVRHIMGRLATISFFKTWYKSRLHNMHKYICIVFIWHVTMVVNARWLHDME